MRQDTNMIAMVKGLERYVFLFADDRRDDIRNTMARFAADPALSFTWYDASVLGERVRDQELDARNRLEFEDEFEDEFEED